jgi:hypothetical protein
MDTEIVDYHGQKYSLQVSPLGSTLFPVGHSTLSSESSELSQEMVVANMFVSAMSPLNLIIYQF